MDEQTKATQTPETGADGGSTGTNTDAKDNKPTIEDLMAELAKERANSAKMKASFDKASSDVATLKKQLREKQTSDELEAEKELEQKEYIASLERRIKHSEAQNRYIAMGMDEAMAKDTADAELDGDMDTVIANCNKNKESAIKKAEAEWLASRPQANSGSGTSQITKEQFSKMSMAERSKLYNENREEYERLLRS